MDLSFFIENIAFFIFLLVLVLFLWTKRKDLKLNGSFPGLYILMYRTKMGLDKMDRWSKKHPKVFLYLAYLSIFVGIVGMVGSFIFMFWQLNFILDNDLPTGGGMVLPLKTEKGLEGSVPVLYVPFWYWIISLFILIVVHEFAHGVIAERFKIKVKSSGLAFFGSFIIGLIIILINILNADIFNFGVAGTFLSLNIENFTVELLVYIIIGIVFMFLPLMPGAFVEPDEESLNKKPWWQKIAVMGAGSTSNFLFGGLFLLMLLFVATPLVDNTMEIHQISFSNVLNESDLKDYNITSGELIALNGIYDKNEIVKKFSNISVNESINMTIKNQDNVTESYMITTFENTQVAGRGMMGIGGIDMDWGNKDGFWFLGDLPFHFFELLKWMALLNIGIGIMNLLPIWITDGGQIARVLGEKYLGEKNGLRVYNILSIIVLVLIMFTLWPSLMMGLF